ncbi:MAG TPA: hydrogenase/urease maturation nickel metallochaperone HypA [Gemmatimonadaceae bacterium]|nr:hydrogenase/urease maturation nickel metallochaperone HypA [Gemmatimonadaceae bacterium]
MHELSVALEVCRMAEERLGATVSSLRLVRLEVGDDAGLEPENLAFCLDALLSQPPFGAAHAELARGPGDVLRVDYFEVDDGHPDD